MSAKDGGLAFPFGKASDGERFYGKGMTLRDYFAAKALTGLLASDEGEGDTLPMTEWIWSDIADCAYKMADAMLAARQHRDKPADADEVGDRR